MQTNLRVFSRSSITSILLLGTFASSSFLSSCHEKQSAALRGVRDDTNVDKLGATSSSCRAKGALSRTYATNVDHYYQKFKKIPSPTIMHDSLDRLLDVDKRSHLSMNSNNEDIPFSDKILVIGDVHGCFNELKALVEKAMNLHNDGKLFSAVVLVGDLCNKGPHSAEVIRFVRNEKNWFSVRGNHDNHALAASLGDETKRTQMGLKSKYQWVHSLSDDDIVWMSNLPYTITIPRNMDLAMIDPSSEQLDKDCNVIVVHAGLIPNIYLDDQDILTMTTIRDVVATYSTRIDVDRQKDLEVGSKQCSYTYYNPNDDACLGTKPIAWAHAWQGPELVIFGHDAKRGLQHENHAIGLDSGACYGKKLTGIVLPEKELVSVDSEKVHCPIKRK